MTTSSEDVLRHFEHVKVKKNDGVLYLMAERIAWMPNGKDTFTISCKYADIKTQKISPEGKPKIQLQIVLHTNESTTFQFVNPEGVPSQLSDRNQVKELLQHLLPKFQRKLSKDIEEKSRILSQYPELFELYKQLVQTGVISVDDFWTNYAKKGIKSLVNDMKTQNVGVSQAFLSDIKPEVDGCNGIKYNITKDIIDSIFRTYPAVKKKHFENVPHKMSEAEFWQKFFQSHYFHRDRSSSSSSKDLFSDCAKNDELDIKRALVRGIIDPFVDITSFDDHIAIDGIGNKTLESPVSGKSHDLSESTQALIKRFNHHSMMVLESCLRTSSEPPAPLTNGVIKNKSKSSQEHLKRSESSMDEVDNASLDETELEKSKTKKMRLKEKTDFEDLEEVEMRQDKSVPLRIADKNAYLTGPLPNVYCDNYSAPGNSSNGFTYDAVDQLANYLNDWRPDCRTSLSSPAAIHALSELSPGGLLMVSSATSNLKEEISLALQKELRNLIIALNELLRHFWSCFPVTTPQLTDKLRHMVNTLEEFRSKRLDPFREKLMKEHYNTDLIAHLDHQLHKTTIKFNNWKLRQNLNINGKK